MSMTYELKAVPETEKMRSSGNAYTYASDEPLSFHGVVTGYEFGQQPYRGTRQWQIGVS